MMDLTLTLLLVSLVITGISVAIASVYGGLILGAAVGSIGIIGLAFIPSPPLIPQWIAIFLILIEVVYAASRVAGIFNFGGGINGGAS
jgi:hypothetical protein